MNNDTLITITEIKNGHATGKSYDITAGEYISIVKTQNGNGELDIVEPIEFDEDGDAVEFSEDKFWDLPIEEQLDRCIRREEDNYAATINYVVAA